MERRGGRSGQCRLQRVTLSFARPPKCQSWRRLVFPARPLSLFASFLSINLNQRLPTSSARMEEDRAVASSSDAASTSSPLPSISDSKQPLPPSILKSSVLHPPSRPGTPDNASSIHFSSGNHPEHVAEALPASSSSDPHSDPLHSVHPASRPSSLRRVSDDSLGQHAHTPSPAPSTASPLPTATPDDGGSGAHPHGILKRKPQPNYGGNPGTGPSLSKSRTSSSGGLSADIKPGYERRVVSRRPRHRPTGWGSASMLMLIISTSRSLTRASTP